jgi:Ala-tRNA(Pro) deacylase
MPTTSGAGAGEAVARATAPIAAAGIEHEIVEHDPTYRAEDEARAGGFHPADTVKTLVLVDHDALRLAVIPASHRLDVERVRTLLAASRHLRLATEEEIRAAFPEFEVGALPPFASERVPELLDVRLLYRERVLCAAGDHRHGVVLDPRDLVRLAEPRVGDICDRAFGEHRFADVPHP